MVVVVNREICSIEAATRSDLYCLYVLHIHFLTYLLYPYGFSGSATVSVPLGRS